MKNLIILIAVFIVSCGQKPPSIKGFATTKKQFEANLANALKLKLISRSSDFGWYINIVNDTIVGYQREIKNDQEYLWFFFQSIKNPKYKIEIQNDSLRSCCLTPIDYYRSGCLYFGEFGTSRMQTLCADGKLTNYFTKYADTLFYANKVMIYRNKAAIASMNGIYVFDIAQQKLLWKHKYHESPMEGFSAIIGKHLYYSETIQKNTHLTCLDLQTLSVVWQTTINSDPEYQYFVEYQPSLQLYTDGKDIIMPCTKACYLINSNTGKIDGKGTWKNFGDGRPPSFKVVEGKLYANNYKNDMQLLCIDMKSDSTIWSLKKAFFVGVYNEHVVAVNYKENYCLIINKNSGKTKNKIDMPYSYRTEVGFIDKYLLINHNALYQ